MKVWELRSRDETYSTISVLQLLTTFGKPDLATLSLLNDEYPLYTKLIEDGNSFYRSVAIAYIMSSDSWRFQQLFKDIYHLNLSSVRIESIPQQFLPIYSQQELKKLLEEGWKTFIEDIEVFERGSIDGLLKVLNERHLLEFLLILYFRALNNHEVSSKTVPRFHISNQQELSSNILTYGSQKLDDEEIKSMARALKSQLYVVTLDANHNLTTKVFQIPQTKNLILKRLPLLKVRNTFNPLYTTNQVKQSKQGNQHKLKKSLISFGKKSSHDNTQSLQYPTFNQTPLNQNRLNKNPSNNLELKFDETYSSSSDQDQLPIRSTESKQASISRFFPSTYSPNTNYTSKLQANILNILKIVIAIVGVICLFFTIYKIKAYRAEKPPSYPAREAHFQLNQFGQYIQM